MLEPLLCAWVYRGLHHFQVVDEGTLVGLSTVNVNVIGASRSCAVEVRRGVELQQLQTFGQGRSRDFTGNLISAGANPLVV